jgi:MFS transporter, ACS family, hexuronate transporter
VATGLLGLLWIPLWNRTARLAPGSGHQGPRAGRSGSGAWEVLRSRRSWAFVAANALSMIPYSLWTNWTTLYLVEAKHLTLVQAAWYAWIPPLFATLGGFAGGWLSLRWMKRGFEAVAARTRVCCLSALVAMATAVIPLLPTAGWASAGISLSIFSVCAFSVNMYTMPLDTFGGARAAFAVSILVSSYGAVQALVSPAFGALIDSYGYGPVCLLASVMPLLGYGVLKWTESEPS